MTTYDDEKAAISRTSQNLVNIELDYCARIFGVSPCLATGTPCYNTWITCKYTSAYLNNPKQYKFSRNDRPLVGPNIRPYLIDYKELPVEIDTTRGIAINARITLELFDDENDSDVGIDPYVSQRSSVQGSFWKKLLARNPYYLGRMVTVKKGFHGLTESEYIISFMGIIDSIEGPTNGKIKIIVKDYLKKADKTDVPPSTKGKVADNPLTAGATIINLDDSSEYDASGYVRIENEIIQYTGKAGNQIIGCTRGTFGTTAIQHNKDTLIQQCAIWQNQNPWDIVYDMLVNKVNIPICYIDTTGALNEKDMWLQGYSFTGIISKPTKASELIKEVCEQSHTYIWWDNENSLIKFKVIAPPLPNQSLKSLSDTDMVNKSTSIDKNEVSRISRIILQYNKNTISEEYTSKYIIIDTDKEGGKEYNEKAIKKIDSRWITQSVHAATIGGRILQRFKNPPLIYIFSLEMKDDSLKTGDICKITSDDFLDRTGAQEMKKFHIIRKNIKDNIIEYKAIDTQFSKRYGLIAPAGYPDYPSANASQREYAYIGDSANKVNIGTEDGYYIW